MKKYRFGFDIWGLVLFFLIMIPNFVWFAVPVPHDILRVESVTPVADKIASIAQVVMIICLCIFRNTGIEKIRITNSGVILGLTIFPCLAFLFYSFDRKNMFAFVPALIFTICHLVYACVNYIV